MKNIILLGIIIYQKTVSLDHGFFSRLYPYGFCKFYPTCSQFTAQAIKKHGVFLGIYYACIRMGKCNPWHKGGINHI